MKKEQEFNYSVGEFAMNEMLYYALYTVENRAIPSMIDGLKPSQRFYLYSSINNSQKEFKKVSAISGIVSEYGYSHGETSVAGAGILMASDWNNNLRLVDSRGAFGSRLVKESGAARYIYTKLHPDFYKWIKDLDLVPEHEDPEHEPPKFYIPIIPLVLANGVEGISTGYKTKILPRDIGSLVDSCREYIKTGKIKEKPQIKFPHSSITVEETEDGKYVCSGHFERNGKTKIVITEVPYNFTREKYIQHLDKLEDDDKIVGYVDKCGKEFRFDVTLKKNNNLSDDDIMKLFKLSANESEILNVISPEGKLRTYEDPRDIIKDFCDWRMENVLTKRISHEKAKAKKEAENINYKIVFIEWYLDTGYSFKDKKKKDAISDIHKGTKIPEDMIESILRMSIMSFTKEMVEDLRKEIKKKEDALEYWEKATPKSEFLNDLKV